MTKEFLIESINFFREHRKTIKDNKLDLEFKNYINVLKNIKSNLPKLDKSEMEKIELEILSFKSVIVKI